MAAIDELSTFAAPEDPYRTTGDNDIGLSDYVRKFAADAYGVPGQLAGAAEYAFRVPSGTDLERIRDWSEEGAQAQVKKMSPGAQRNLQATFLPGEGPTIWDKDISTGHALGLRAVGAIPSVLASIIPGAMVARVAGATAGALVGGAAAAGQTAGDTYNQIVGEFRDTPDDQLREQSPAYQGFRNMGMSEREARERLVETVTSYKPALMGAITAVTSKYGVEGLTARRFGGEAAKGSIRGHIAGATAGEFVQEGIENASQELLQQQAGFDLRGVQGEYNWAKILEEAVSGAAIGGIMGGGVGVATARGGHSGGRRRTRDEILGKPTPELDQKPDETAVPVAVAPTSVSPAQSTEPVLSEVRAKGDADRAAVAAEQTNPVKAGEEMPAAIAQKPAETHGGVDLKPGEPTPALTPTTVTVDPDQAVALTAPTAVPQAITSTTQQRQHDLISQAEQELIPPIPAHSVTSPEIAAAITHAPSIVKGMIDAKVSEAAIQSAPARPDPAAALSAAAVPAATGADTATTASAPVAPAVGLAGASTATAQTLAETPVTLVPSEVITPAVAEPPVKRKPGRPRKNVAAPATPGQSAPDHADTHAAKVKATTDDGVARIADLIRARETALKSVTDFADGVPIATKAANEITAIMEAAVPVLGKREAFKLADQARKIVEAEKAAPAATIAAAPALDVDIAPKGRILKDELAARRERKGPRETAHKKAQRERGEAEILGKDEDDARQRGRALNEVAASVRKAFDEVTYDRAEMSTAKAQRDYMKALLRAVPIPTDPTTGKKLSLANLPADAPGELRHLVAAKALAQGAGTETQRFDFMANDIALREGKDLSTEYARTQATKASPEFTEEAAGAKVRDESGGRNLEEERALGGAYWTQRIKELGRETKKIRREKVEALKYREQLRAEGPAEPEPPVVKVEKKARLSPAEIKARAAAIREGLQTKRAEAVERAEASPRTEEQAIRQIETIRLGENTDEVAATEGERFKQLPGDSRPPMGTMTIKGRNAGEVTLQSPQKLSDFMRDIPFSSAQFAPGESEMGRELAKIFEKHVGGTRVYWATPGELLTITGDDRSHGLYLYDKGVIVINDRLKSRGKITELAATTLHEAAHAALFDVLDTNPQAAITVTKMARAVRDELVRRNIPITGKGATYGLSLDRHGNPDIHEFMSEALSNPDFQRILAETKATQELIDEVGLDKPGSTIWDAFVGAARRWFGLGRNQVSILDIAMRHADNIMTVDGHISSRPEGFKRLIASDFKDGMDDRLAATSLNVSRWGKAVQTFDQLVRNARSHFEGSAPDDASNALATMDKQATDGAIASMRIAAKWIEFERANPEVAAQAKNVGILAERNQIDPRKDKNADPSLTGDKFREYQRVARYDEIREKWDALPREARELLSEMFDHYGRSNRQLAEVRATRVVEIWEKLSGTKLTTTERASLSERIVNGDLTEKGSDTLKPGQISDEELIGNDDVFRDMQKHALQSKNIYLPHDRHGNIVVRTKEKLPDLMGGKVIEEDDKHAVVEFSGKDARDKYEAWAKSQAMIDGPDVTSVNLRRYLIPSGEPVSEINSRGHDHEVRVEARVELQGLYAFDKGRDANAFIKEAKATGAFAEIDQKPLQRADSYDEGELAPTQLSGILRGIDKHKGMDEGTKNLMKATVESAAVRLMPGHRIQQRMLKRHNIRGESQDLSRSLISYGVTASEAMAKMEHMHKVQDALENMRSQIGKVGSKDAQQQSLFVGEMTKRVYDNVVHPHDTARWMQDLLRLSQLDKLASPAYTIINGMQPWMVTLPVLGSEHGNMRAAAELGRAYKDMGFGSIFRDAFGNMKKATSNFTKFGIDINNPVDSAMKKIAGRDDGKRLNDGLRKAVSLGRIQETAGIEVGSAGRPPGGKARMVADGVDRIARQLPIAMETVNRVGTFIAAYRLAYAQTSNHDMAVQYGIDMIDRTQFNYAAWNKPAFFNKPWLRPALQFKAYAQGMTALLADATYKTFNGATKKEKQQAFKLLMNIVGVQVAMAGAMGLPGIELIKAGFMIAAMLGLGGGWDDAERCLRQISDDAFGKKTSELIHKGVLSRAIGVDLSSRVGLSDMWLFGEPKMYDRQGTLAYFGQLLMGAPGGLILDWSEGLKAAGSGDFAKSFELMMPVKFIADTASATRGRFDPNSKAVLSTGDAVLKSIGFRTAAAVERGFEKGKTIQVSKDMNAKARELEKDYLQATTAGERVKIKARILTHNREMNEKKLGLKQKALSPKTLDGIRERRKAERSQITGD